MMPREPEEQQPDIEATEQATGELADTSEALGLAKKQAEDYLESLKRCQADFANLKRRTDQEKLEMGKYANNQLILNLLPVLDDFERAFSNMSPDITGSDWAKGFKLIETKMKDILQTCSLCKIEAVGQPFDPNLHEAMVRCPGEEGMVVQELRCGYKIGDKVIRPSQVMVGEGETEAPEEKEGRKTGRKSQSKHNE